MSAQSTWQTEMANGRENGDRSELNERSNFARVTSGREEVLEPWRGTQIFGRQSTFLRHFAARSGMQQLPVQTLVDALGVPQVRHNY